MSKQVRQGSLKRNLGLWAIVGLGLGYMTPTVVYDTFGLVSERTNGAVPTAYLVALVVMAFTAISYGKMVRAFPSAGSAYTYTREAIHPNLGFIVGWIALLDYLLLPLVNILILRLYMEYAFPDVPGWMFAVVFTVIVTGSVALSMRGTSNFNGILLIYSLAVMIVFTVLISMQVSEGRGTGTLLSGAPFVGTDFDMTNIIYGATLVCFSFIGFDAITMYAQEAKDQRVMPRAILITVLIGGAIFLLGSYFAQQRWPDVSEFAEYTGNPLPHFGFIAGGDVFMWFFTAAGFAATMASGLASHASVSRMLMVMGRKGVLPKRVFGHVSPKTHTPLTNVLIVGLVSLGAIFLDLDTVASVINFGALIAFTFMNISVIAWFAIRQGKHKNGKDIFNYIVMPVIATLLTVMLWVNLDEISLTVGFIWLGVGVIYLAFITGGFNKQPKGFDESEPVTGFNKVADEA
ncbi:APC family permease [Canibacter sp. lx-45]|uniref:APC family permease n=1 Tax=Canibacter zhuwentaonis TaxID=2837491 RepID=UPI001BDC2431|nr:APC family permease [Canibacter zhuwentaonis]MBT1035316.1 APC family permease [Canibacter zhuwentaonis]